MSDPEAVSGREDPAVDGEGVGSGQGASDGGSVSVARQLGPEIRLGLAAPLMAALAAPTAVGLLAWAVLALAAPRGLGAIVPAMAAAGGGLAAGVLVLQPWRIRPVVRWMQWWMGTLGASFLATVAVGVGLLYSSPHDERAFLGVLIAVGHFVTLMAVSVVVTSQIRARCAALSAAPSDPSSST